MWTLIIVVALAVPTSYYWLFTRQDREPTGGLVVVVLMACVAVLALILGFIALDHRR